MPLVQKPSMSTPRLRLLAFAVLLAGPTLARGVSADEPPAPAEPAPAESPPAESPPEEPEAPAAPLDLKIKTAIDKGVAFLRTQQMHGGTWGEINSPNKTYGGGKNGWKNPIGATSLALYAMLKCGVPVTDPAVKNGFAWLKKTPISPLHSAYEVSAALLAVTAVADPFKKTKDARAAGARVRLTGEWREWATSLQGALMARRGGPRGWRYGVNTVDPGGKEDVSSTQFAILALAAADRCGLPVDPSVYAGAAAYVLTLQEAEGPEVERALRAKKLLKEKKPVEDGYAKPKPKDDVPKKDRARGFTYSIHPTTPAHDKTVTGARTSCGVGTLALARWALDGPEARSLAKGARPSAAAIDTGIYDGLAWLAHNWSPWTHAGRNIYYLYCAERALDLTGAERIGGHIWYLEMVEQLLPEQHPTKGSWDTKDTQFGDRGPVIDTSLALLFLRRAAEGGVPAPIVVTGPDDAPPVDNR